LLQQSGIIWLFVGTLSKVGVQIIVDAEEGSKKKPFFSQKIE
jgi:hypothetical protein